MIRSSLVVAVLVSGLSACATHSTNNVRHTALPGLTPSLRVMTFNIQSGRKGIDKVAELIKDAKADIVGLQEVDRLTERANGEDQVKKLQELTGLKYAAFFKATEFYGGDYGVAILSRYPLTDAEQRGLPTEGAEPRTVGRAVAQTPQGEISVYVTHLSNLFTRGKLRAQQTRMITNWMKGDHRARVLMGDFNDNEQSLAVQGVSATMAEAFTQAGRGPSATYPFPIIPDARLDYVFSTSELRATDAYVVQKVASDHYPMVVDFAQQPMTAKADSTSSATAATAKAAP